MTPVDQADRDLVRDEHGRSVFIEAGAGTGKTTAIVDRIVAMVAAGTGELRRLAAITFTDAAAAELRDRTRAALEHAADGRDERITAPGARARCAEALDQLDDAALTTLHGFAQRILAEHPLEAGLPPGFEVMDEIRSRVEFEQRWAGFVDELFADEDLEPVLLRALALGLAPDLLHGLARALHENHDRLPAPAGPAPSLPLLDASAVIAALDRVLTYRRDACTNPDDLLARHIDSLVEFRRLLELATDELDLLDVLVEAPTATCKNGQKGCWRVDVDVVRRATAEVDAAMDAVRTAQRRTVLAVLFARVVEFVRDAAEARRRSGRLEFHDLLVRARSLLRRDRGVRAALADRYRRVLLDEFQDTDPLQIEIGVLLATDDPDAGDKPWTQVAVRPGALVVVGDPKQSIYRFRRADLRVYHDARHELGLDACSLAENFRSVPGVIEFVNHLFDALLEEEPGVQAAHVELHANRAAIGHDAAVGVFGGPVDANVAEVRAEEADDVAALVRRMKEEEWLVEDPREGVRGARYDDIALLIPSRTVLPALEDALEAADVAVRVESQSLVFSTAEVRDLLAALAAIDDPTDEIAVVAALRSPAFGCSDADLVEFVAAGGRWDYRREPPPALGAAHPVVAGLTALRRFWDDRWWRSVSETVEAIVRERRLLELTLARRRPRDHWRRIRYLLDQARAWDDAGDASLRSFVGWVQQQADERARVIESVAPEPDHDAVRILTVHGSKGLEFPIVVLAGLNTIPPYVDRPVIWTPAGPELRIGIKKANSRVETDGYAAAEQEERRHDEAERARLLYVAMTRARDHLVVSLHHRERSDCHARRIADHLAGAPHVVLDPGGGSSRRAKRDKPGDRPASADPSEREAWIADRSALLARAARPSSVSATKLAKSLAEETADDPALDKEAAPAAAEAPPWRRGRAGTAIGRAVHAVLQTVDLATGADLEPTARAQALAEGVADREREVRDLAASVLAAPIVRAAVAARARCWREVPVAADIDGVLVEGFVDLLVETPDGFVVVDYKTDRVPGEDDRDAALTRYTPQGAAYALAIETVLGRPVARCVFVFAREAGEAVEREITDLPGAVEAVRGQVRQMTTL